jgi:hypothetical protein
MAGRPSFDVATIVRRAATRFRREQGITVSGPAVQTLLLPGLSDQDRLEEDYAAGRFELEEMEAALIDLLMFASSFARSEGRNTLRTLDIELAMREGDCKFKPWC